MKNFIYIVSLFIFFSCGSTKKSGTGVPHPVLGKATPSEPEFLDNITLNPAGTSSPATVSSMPYKGNRGLSDVFYPADIEKCTDLQFKYAILMEDKVEEVTNSKLIGFLEKWYGIPYKYGGVTKSGIDCSAFSALMMSEVFSLTIPRTCREQYGLGKKIKMAQLSRGDLVFFNTTSGISHVGVYLGHDKFAHASTSNGIMISDLKEAYFKRRYVGSTRIR